MTTSEEIEMPDRYDDPRVDNSMVYIDHEGAAFPAYCDPTDGWNGFQIPHFSKAAAVRVVEWNAEYVKGAEENSEHLRWDGDVIILHSPMYKDEPGYSDERIGPDENGRYAIGAANWTWMLARRLPRCDVCGFTTVTHGPGCPEAIAGLTSHPTDES